jgi:transposase InsO family protein
VLTPNQVFVALKFKFYRITYSPPPPLGALRAVGGYCFLFIAIDKFTKWPEATPVVSITQGAAVAFLKSIECRFRVPSRIITDNGTQFTSRLFQEYCEGIGTQLCFAFVAHPKSNG